jgi:photosystem II stability/assembly factor-like uncharacterized protein
VWARVARTVVASLLAAVGAGAAAAATSSESTIGLIQLRSADLGLAVVSPGGLVATDSAGHDVRRVGPRLPTTTHIDDFAFLDRLHGWVVAWNLNDVGVGVYRTRDGGRTWKRVDVTGHSMGAGSVATVRFLDLKHGWLVNQQPTAPDAALYVSVDGGAHWRLVRRSLPQIAPVLFTSGRHAWQAGGPFGHSLFRSTDGGRTWREIRLPLPHDTQRALYDLPVVRGRRVLDAVKVVRRGRVELRIYRSLDDGAGWKLASSLRLPDSSTDSCPMFATRAPPAVSLLTGRVWWAGTYYSGGWHSYFTEDAGRHWRSTVISRVRPSASCAQAASMQAADAKTAWFRFTVGEQSGRLYTTDDGGRHWRRVLLNMP